MGMTHAVISSDEESGDEKPHIYRILVIDDDKACAQTMMWMLEMLGSYAADGPQWANRYRTGQIISSGCRIMRHRDAGNEWLCSMSSYA